MLQVIALLFIICVAFYFYKSRNVNYWKSKNIPTAPGCHWFFGHYMPILLSQKHLGTVFDEIYDSFPDVPFVGYLKMSNPGLVVKDPDFIKTILATDFNNFNKNEISINIKDDKLFGYNPFVNDGERWKVARANATPSVTFVKLKNYYPVFRQVADEMAKYVLGACQEAGGSGATFEAKELAAMFTTDTISNAIYGIDNNTFENKDSLFATLTREILRSSFVDNLKAMSTILFPELTSIMGIRFSSKRSEEVLTSLTKRMMKETSETNRTRTDIFQQMIQNRQSGKADIFTDEYISSHLYAFLLDGYETSSILIAYTLFELAWHQHIQNKLRSEINEMISRTSDNYKVEDVEGLRYLDMVVSETLRLDSPAVVMTKVCTSDYTVSDIPGLERPLVIKKDTVMAIPITSLHMDEKYFPLPNKFDPERFTEEAVANRHKFVYLPFGEGPRKCLGQRFGLLQSKVAIIKIIQKFNLSPSSKSKYPAEIDPQVFIVRKPLNGAWINIKPIS